MEQNNGYRRICNIQYGADINNIGDIYIPGCIGRGIVCLFHGGFWKIPYDKAQFNNVAEKLAKIGFVVWNIEYRRLGYPGAGYPGTFNDVVGAINYLEEIIRKYELNKQQIIIAGHSAGGQLTLWLGANTEMLNVEPKMVIGLAPVVDLEKCYESSDRNNFVYDLLKCSPTENNELYKIVSPIRLISNSIKQAIVYSEKDDVLPVVEIEEYIKRVRDLNGEIEIAKIEKGGHMDFLDANSESIGEFIRIVEENCA